MVFSFFKKPEVIVAKPAAKPGGAARPLSGSEPVEDVGMASEPAKDLESSQSGLSDFVFSESAPQFHLEPEIDPVDADAQEAAILFANAQDSAARTVLENAVRHHAGASSERLWRMLFDLYHLLGDQVAFEALSVDYARAFEKSPPAWRSAPSAPKPAAPSAGSTLFKGELCGDNLAGFAELERAAAGKRQLRLDLSRVRRFDAAGCGQLLAALQRLRKGGCSIELLGRDALGALLAGWLCDTLSRRDARWRVGVPALGCLLSIPTGLAFYSLPAGEVFMLGPWAVPVGIVFYMLFGITAVWWTAPVYTVLAEIVAPHRRATTIAIFNLGLTMLGAGLGPLAIGMLSDVLVPQFANEALRWALALSTALCYLLGMLAFASALRHYKAPAAT